MGKCCTTTNRDNFIELRTAKIRPLVAEVCVLDHVQAHLCKMGKRPYRCRTKGLDISKELLKKNICPIVFEICILQCMDPVDTIFDKFLTYWHAHMEQMGKWPRHCTPSCLGNSFETIDGYFVERFQRYAFHQVWNRLTARPVVPAPILSDTTVWGVAG